MLIRVLLAAAGLSAYGAGAQIPKGELGAWFSADSGVVSDQSGVQEWKDLSGHGLNARTITAKSPRLAPHSLNGLPTVRFNGFDNGMVTPPCATFPRKRGTVVVVARCVGRSGTSGIGYNNYVATYHGKRAKAAWQFGSYEQNFSFYDGIGGRLTHISNEIVGNWELLTLVRYDDSLMCLYRGGRRLHDFQVGDVIPDTNSLKIGFNGKLSDDSIPEVLNGEIAEILIYNRALNESELQVVHGYLSKKWGLILAKPPVWQRWWFYIGIILVAMAFAAAGARYYTLRKLQKRWEKERELEAERNRISKDMHDEIGSGLTHIALLSELIQAGQRKEDWQKDVQTISVSARRLVRNMSEIIWTLNPQNDSLESLAAYMREQAQEYFEPFPIEFAIHFPRELPVVKLSNEERRNLFLVVKEALHNALKHAAADRIDLTLETTREHIVFTVQDDGKGMSDKVRAGANGLRNMEKRMLDIGGSCSIATGASGTVIRFVFPLQPLKKIRNSG